MHCKSCEILIKQSLNDIQWCSVQSISHKTGVCEVHCDQRDIPELESVINKAGYTIWEDNTEQPRTSDERIEKVVWLALAGVLIFALIQSDVAGLIPQYNTLSLGIAFIIGLVASISTCLALTGGIIIGYNESVQTTNPLMTQVKFHIWRLLAFIIWWWILGLVWWSFSGSVRFNAIFSVMVGLVLLYLGLQLLWITPSITKRWFHLPGTFSQLIFNLKNPQYAWIVWALTFLLPCGFTQSMQLFALQSGSFMEWASIMWAFALGTLPVLFSIGWWTKYIKDKLKLINPLIAALLIVFWLYTIYNGSILARTLVSSTNYSITQHLEVETIAIWHDGTQFTPNPIKLAVGKNYKLIVTPSSDGLWCMSQVIIPGKWSHTIKKWETFEINVDGSVAKTITLVCAAMGMQQGQIIVQ